jgi:branched-chain amino acid transport system permease protein
MGEVFNKRRLVFWGAVAIVLIVLPYLFKAGFALSMLCQMGIALIFALSYNMLLGQTGLLSFGHAVYFGLGAFFCAHALNLLAAGKLSIPVTFIPLVGGITGLMYGLIFGFVTTRRAGTPFAMISLGIAEMVAACSLMFPAFFGGEGGIPTNRQVGPAVMGITYGPQIQVYYLIAGWAFVSMIAMFALTQTPLGRMANAVRDNPERAQFIGYNTTRVRFLMLTLSAFFAGIAGGLAAINYEIVTAETLGVTASGNVVLMAFIGGIGHFWGPVVGAVLVSFLQSALSSYTQAWLLYFGLLFLVIILFSPGGIANLVTLHKPAWRAGLTRVLVPSYLLAALTGLFAVSGFVALVEMLYHLESKESAGAFVFFGVNLDPTRPVAWLGAAVLFVVGVGLLYAASRVVSRAWDRVNAGLLAGKAS